MAMMIRRTIWVIGALPAVTIGVALVARGILILTGQVTPGLLSWIEVNANKPALPVNGISATLGAVGNVAPGIAMIVLTILTRTRSRKWVSVVSWVSLLWAGGMLLDVAGGVLLKTSGIVGITRSFFIFVGMTATGLSGLFLMRDVEKTEQQSE